jgi:methylmalonyl-CoA/ethylmalonyl-CoA epimerase
MSTVSLQRIRQIAIRVHDVPRAVRFYRDVLELPFLFEAGPKMAFFDCGGVRLMLSTAEEAEFDHPGSILYYLVDDIVATHRTLTERGVTFVDEPHLLARLPDHELWLTAFKDSEGNHLALMEERR